MYIPWWGINYRFFFIVSAADSVCFTWFFGVVSPVLSAIISVLIWIVVVAYFSVLFISDERVVFAVSATHQIPILGSAKNWKQKLTLLFSWRKNQIFKKCQIMMLNSTYVLYNKLYPTYAKKRYFIWMVLFLFNRIRFIR